MRSLMPDVFVNLGGRGDVRGFVKSGWYTSGVWFFAVLGEREREREREKREKREERQKRDRDSSIPLAPPDPFPSLRQDTAS